MKHANGNTALAMGPLPAHSRLRIVPRAKRVKELDDIEASVAAAAFNGAISAKRLSVDKSADTQTRQRAHAIARDLEEKFLRVLMDCPIEYQPAKLRRFAKALDKANRGPRDMVWFNMSLVVQHCLRCGQPVPSVREFEKWFRSSGFPVSHTNVKKKRQMFNAPRRPPGRRRLGAKPFNFPAFVNIWK